MVRVWSVVVAGVIVAGSYWALWSLLLSTCLGEGGGLRDTDLVNPSLEGVPATPTAARNVTGDDTDEVAGMTPCRKYSEWLREDVTALSRRRLVIQPVFGTAEHFMQPGHVHTVCP